MAKNLVKSNNKKIKKALELLDELSVLTGQDMQLLKEILETGKLPTLIKD